MPPAKAHRYLVSFIRMGLAEQDAQTGRYDLGEFALRLGLVGLARMDPVRLGVPVLADLCDEIEETCALAVWGNLRRDRRAMGGTGPGSYGKSAHWRRIALVDFGYRVVLRGVLTGSAVGATAPHGINRAAP